MTFDDSKFDLEFEDDYELLSDEDLADLADHGDLEDLTDLEDNE